MSMSEDIIKTIAKRKQLSLKEQKDLIFEIFDCLEWDYDKDEYLMLIHLAILRDNKLEVENGN